LARVADQRLTTRSATRCLENYQKVTAIERAAKLARGDLLVELIDVYGVRAIDIARRTGERPGDLSEMVAVCRTFPRQSRQRDAIYNHLLLATRAMRRFPTLGLTPEAALREIIRTGLTQHRDVTRHFDRLSRRRSTHLLEGPSVEASDPLLDRCHHARVQDVLPRLADGSIQMLAIDPVYVFARSNSTYRARAARSRDCDDMHDPAAAIGTVIDVLRISQPKLAPGGVFLLWQPWQSLRPEIMAAADEHGWVIDGPIIWDKGRPQPGRFDSPYSPQGEFLWLLHRPGDSPVDCDGDLSREMILNFPPVSAPSSAHQQLHAFEKPVALCEHLVRKHSRPGDVVVDACACTGSMSVAARKLGRRWVYIESSNENFAIGAGRLAPRD
jgi:DNA modification methylase